MNFYMENVPGKVVFKHASASVLNASLSCSDDVKASCRVILLNIQSHVTQQADVCGCIELFDSLCFILNIHVCVRCQL